MYQIFTLCNDDPNFRRFLDSKFVKTCNEFVLGQEFFSQNCIENACARVAMKTKKFKNFSPEKDIGGLQERFD